MADQHEHKEGKNRIFHQTEKGVTGGDVVESDAGAGERLLDSGGDARGVAVGGDGHGPTVVELGEGGADVLGDGVGIAALGHLAVLDVPPHRRLRPHVLRLRQATPAVAATAAHAFSPRSSPGDRDGRNRSHMRETHANGATGSGPASACARPVERERGERRGKVGGRRGVR